MSLSNPAQVLLLGTFHFADRGLDAYQPKSVFDPVARQEEIQDVITCLEAYHPTKIAVERHAGEKARLEKEYRAYTEKTFQLPADEIYQLGFQLANRLGHKRLYGVNAWERYYEPPLDIEKLADSRSASELNTYISDHHPDFRPYEDLADYAEKHGQTHFLTEWDAHYHAEYAQEDRERLELTLRSILRRANDAEHILRGHGSYLVGPIKIGLGRDYPGVDYLTRWYNRNLRIFANLQRITKTGDRLMLIIGGGHVPILRHCIESSPEYDLVEVSAYL